MFPEFTSRQAFAGKDLCRKTPMTIPQEQHRSFDLAIVVVVHPFALGYCNCSRSNGLFESLNGLQTMNVIRIRQQRIKDLQIVPITPSKRIECGSIFVHGEANVRSLGL